MSRLKENAELAQKLMDELVSASKEVIKNIFLKGQEVTFEKGVYVHDFADGALWMAKDNAIKDIPYRGFILNKSHRHRYYLNPLNEGQKVSIDVLTIDDTIRLIKFLDRNGYDLDELMENTQAEPVDEDKTHEEEKPKEEPAKDEVQVGTVEPEANPEGDDSNQETPDDKRDGEDAEEQSVACYTGKPITPSADIF